MPGNDALGMPLHFATRRRRRRAASAPGKFKVRIHTSTDVDRIEANFRVDSKQVSERTGRLAESSLGPLAAVRYV